ncbi:MAG: outer membrane beta-barrel protein, partial [Bdellovibrionota bacterium]
MPWTAQVDMRQTATDKGTACTGTCTVDTQTFFAVGATTKFDLANNFALRTGGILAQRGYKQTNASVSDTVNFTYLDVPVLPEYQFNEMFSAHAGLVVGLKAARSCGVSSGCTNITDKSLVTPLQVGGTYNIDKQWAAKLTFETGTTLFTDTTNDFKTANAIALGGAYTF